MKETDTITKNTISNNANSDGKNIAIISYITLIGFVVAFVMNNEKKNAFASYHIKQSLGLGLTGMCLWVIGIIPILGWIISILGTFFIIFLWIMGLINAISEKEKPVPVLGKTYEQWFKSL